MPKFKIAVTKDQKRYTLVMSEKDEKAVRERVHKEGYSILSIHEITDENVLGKKFVFEAELEGNIKTGRVVGDDIFKIYSKLRRDLGYEVHFIYPENQEGVDEAYKKKLLTQLEEEFEIFSQSKTELQDVKKHAEEDKKQLKKQEGSSISQGNIDNFYMKKSLDETYKLIDSVIEKLMNLLEGREITNISDDQKEKLKIVLNSIVKIKKTTNISKLKEIGELALLKIGIIELRELEKTKDVKLKGILKETNSLLKNIGSSRQFIEKDKDIKYIIESLIQSIVDKFQYLILIPEKHKKIKQDKSSHYYIKNELLLKKYRERLQSNTREYIKNIHIIILPFLNPEKNFDLGLKRKVIKQNILLLEAKKKNGLGFSITTITKGAERIFNNIQLLFDRIRLMLASVFYGYAFIIIIYFNTVYIFDDIHLSYNGLFYTLVSLLFYMIFSLKIKYISLPINIIFLLLNFAFLLFLVIFGLINF